ncbi:MAG: NAD(+) synthase [Planctomycetales bacterium]
MIEMTATLDAPVSADELLHLDADAEIARIALAIRAQTTGTLKRKGVVLGLSGGIDSSVCAALCVEALGPKRVFGIMMPENDSDPESERLGRLIAETYGIEAITEDVGPTLAAAGCYSRREEAVRAVIPEFQPEDKFKLVLSELSADSPYRFFFVVVELADGRRVKARLPLDAYQTIVAATNFKQRVRKMIEYYHADRLRYAVIGTPNRLEYDQGFFVKNGDGAADLKPIAHLYKTQVYRLAAALGVPEEIRLRPPTTDTYSLAQSQEEFFFSLPYQQLDVCLCAKDRGLPAEAITEAVNLSVEHVERVFQDIDAKRAMATYLHAGPMLVEPGGENG